MIISKEKFVNTKRRRCLVFKAKYQMNGAALYIHTLLPSCGVDIREKYNDHVNLLSGGCATIDADCVNARETALVCCCQAP